MRYMHSPGKSLGFLKLGNADKTSIIVDACCGFNVIRRAVKN